MDVLAGTSGYSYDEWLGSFYPDGTNKEGMLAHYASKLPTVEINNTFYRMPKSSVVEKWRDATPGSFRFVLKATRRITHFARLVDVGETLGHLYRTARVLEDQLGAVLYQLPPNLKKDVPRLEAFLAELPDDHRAAIEVRHQSWHCDEVFEALRRREVALVVADADQEAEAPSLVATAPFGYLRLRRTAYADEDLDAWAARIADQPWDRAFVFFKHEVRGPELARSLLERVGGA